MYVYNAAQNADAEAAQDEQRTKRLFVGMIASALGVDQNYSADDGQVYQRTGQYTIANSDGGAAILGQSVSNGNTVTQVAGIPVGWIVLAGLAFLLMRR